MPDPPAEKAGKCPDNTVISHVIGADDIDIRAQGGIAWAQVARAVYPEGRRCTVHDRCG